MNLPFDTGSTPIAFTNTAEEECPPHAVLACHGFEYDATNRALKLKCRKPTAEDVGSDETIYAFNGPTKVAAGKPGACVMARHAAQWARVDPEYDFGEFDEAEDYFVLRIGPVAGQWHVSRDGEGFVLVGLRDDAGAIHEGRVLVLQDLRAGDQVRFAVITKAASALDCSSIQVNTDTNVGVGEYLEGKFCNEAGAIEVGDGDGQDEGEPVEIYASKALRGFMARGVVVRVVPRKIDNGQNTVYDAVSGGLEAATGTVITAAGTDYTVQVLSPGTGTVIVPATSVHGDEFAVTDVVSLTWEWLTPDTTRLRISDFSCPTVATGLF